MKAPGIHCYVEGSIPAVTPKYRTKKMEKMLFGAHEKNKGTIIGFYNNCQTLALRFNSQS
jgi:hypothetical protein